MHLVERLGPPTHRLGGIGVRRVIAAVVVPSRERQRVPRFHRERLTESIEKLPVEVIPRDVEQRSGRAAAAGVCTF